MSADVRTDNNGKKFRVVLLRHGESLWNKENRFTGWANPPLTQKGVDQAVTAGRAMKRMGFSFRKAYGSDLVRAFNTTAIVLENMGRDKLEIVQDIRLRERSYGLYTGMNKDEAVATLGKEEVHKIRRAYDHPIKDGVYDGKIMPGETIKGMVEGRVGEFFNEVLLQAMFEAPVDPESEDILIGAHGNTNRSFNPLLGTRTSKTIEDTEFATAAPQVFVCSLEGDRIKISEVFSIVSGEQEAFDVPNLPIYVGKSGIITFENNM